MSATSTNPLQIDIGKAFTFLLDDPEWLKKVLIGGLISIIPFIGNLIVYGYSIEVARRVFYAPNTRELPEWDDIGGYLARGFFFWLGLFIWALPFILLVACGVIGALALGVASGEEAFIGVSLGLLYCTILPFILIYTLVASFVVPVLLGRYAIHGRLQSMFEFSEIIAELRRVGIVPLILLVAIVYAATYIGQLGVALCIIGFIFTTFYGRIAIAHAAGQNYRLARGLQPPPPTPAPAAAPPTTI